LPARAWGGTGISGIPGIPGMSFIGALISIFMLIEQQEPQPPPQAVAMSAEHKTPQQPRTEVARNFNMSESPR